MINHLNSFLFLPNNFTLFPDYVEVSSSVKQGNNSTCVQGCCWESELVYGTVTRPVNIGQIRKSVLSGFLINHSLRAREGLSSLTLLTQKTEMNTW